VIRLLLLWLLAPMTIASAQADLPPPAAAAQLARQPRTARALIWIDRNLEWITAQHIRIAELPAPTFEEARRAALLKDLLEAAGLKCRTDDLGNVFAERPAASLRDRREPADVVILSAHLDTVFPRGTDVRVRREGGQLRAPGISDNSSGLAALVALAYAFHAAKLQTRSTIVFAANVGEEGEGNLRGMRKLVEAYKPRLRAVVAIDGASADHITSMALASRRIEAVVEGPGGHSWADFGFPNPIHALSRGIARFVKVKVPDSPRTSFNVGLIEGGTSVNSIPFRAAMKLDLRSEADPELDKLEAAFREAMQAGVDEEMAAAREHGAGARVAGEALALKINVIGARPGGELPEDSPLIAAVRSADKFLGHRSRLERSSTDANIPLSLGIPAIALGGGGKGGGAHSLHEWYDPADRALGLKRLLLTLLAIAGVEE
jgi:acetylornithine deacetylase/succinyl-diaminopimelate desuccinylase-like protein